jgi:hypothetical protein
MEVVVKLEDDADATPALDSAGAGLVPLFGPSEDRVRQRSAEAGRDDPPGSRSHWRYARHLAAA